MAICSKCKKEISFLMAYSDDYGNKFCTNCWEIKKSKEEGRGEIKNQKEVTIKINKEDKAKQKQAGWSLVGLIGLAIMVAWFMSMHYSLKIDDYQSCIDECVYDNQNCVSDYDNCMTLSIAYDKSRNGWITDNDYEECSLDFELCSSDLEMCINDCEP